MTDLLKPKDELWNIIEKIGRNETVVQHGLEIKLLTNADREHTAMIMVIALYETLSNLRNQFLKIQENMEDRLPCGHKREYLVYGSKRVYCSICAR